MSIFGKIVDSIFGSSEAKAEEAKSAEAQAEEGKAPTAAPGEAAAAEPITVEEVEIIIAKIDANRPGDYNWKQSIVDLMKLLDLDSSLGARKELAQELGYTGALDGSAEMNIWLHKQVMEKLAESGGKVPDSLK
ncbi:hypothetical protein A7A08_00602 [Methyloligella halotolerans]|uniref:DUF3597 domain-containing protein n=1 Tax=Methyloligella halotolerans TaxID=1177755 RepID=A0A1E2S360_9HYPH|nr:DUF3597 domain-containing protein [Methyloligella halotolerans]ODA68768.1 hypothetical protein A7A08_00602 [Methyloligella halotolerans]